MNSAFSTPGLNQAHVKQVTHPVTHEIGWTGGGISTSFNVTFCIGWGLATYKSEGYVYCILPTEGYNIAEGIHQGVGYFRGSESSNAEGARELFALTHVPGAQHAAARKVEIDGKLGPVIFNPECDADRLQKNAEYKKFAETPDLDELVVHELLEGDKLKPSTSRKALLAHQGKNTELKKQIQHEARHRVFGTLPVSQLDREAAGAAVQISADNEDFYRVYIRHHELSLFGCRNKKEFDEAKAPSKDDLLQKHGLKK